ncbi:MAG: hypothetical protein HC836_44570 [Richelia sp. RM2_1_2]|nr:hypothetical protein [Richelia sp. RM2_1_2]
MFEYMKERANINGAQLADEVNASSIGPLCEYVRVDGGSQITFGFTTQLSVEELVVLDAVLANHVAIPPKVLTIDVYQIPSIGGTLSEPMGFSPDETRGNTLLSSETFTIIFSENNINNMDWIQVGLAADTDSGFIMPYDGSVIRATAHCENTNNKTCSFHLYVNELSVGSILQLTGSRQQTASAVNLNAQFSAGDKLRLRGITSGKLEDTIVILWIKWRKA